MIRNDTTGQKFNHWKVLEELGGGKVRCRCTCGTIKDVYKQALKNGTSTSCGCIGKKKHKSIGL